jgi:hypothetical protein
VTVLDLQLRRVIDGMLPMLDALAEMRVLLREGRATASDLLAVVAKHEALIRQAQAAVMAERGAAYAVVLDPIIDKVVETRRAIEEHVQ